MWICVVFCAEGDELTASTGEAQLCKEPGYIINDDPNGAKDDDRPDSSSSARRMYPKLANYFRNPFGSDNVFCVFFVAKSAL